MTLGKPLFLAACGAALALTAPAMAQAPAKLPDWTGVWQMNGNTVFDRASVEPAGGAV